MGVIVAPCVGWEKLWGIDSPFSPFCVAICYMQVAPNIIMVPKIWGVALWLVGERSPLINKQFKNGQKWNLKDNFEFQRKRPRVGEQ